MGKNNSQLKLFLQDYQTDDFEQLIALKVNFRKNLILQYF